MAENKTMPTPADVKTFLDSVADEGKRKDSLALLEIMRRATGLEPVMWGPSIVGFGRYHYRYASGREGDTFYAGFSPRKNALTVYVAGGLEPHRSLVEKLGKHTTGVGCLYIKRLSDVDLAALEQLVREASQEGSLRSAGKV